MAREQSWPLANRPEETWVPGPAVPTLTSQLVFHSFACSAKAELKHMVHEFPYSSNCPRFSLLILSKQPERPLATVQAGIRLGKGKETPGWSEQLWHGRLKNEMDKTLVTCYCHPGCHGPTVAVQFVAARNLSNGGRKRMILRYRSPTSSHSKLWNSRLDNTNQGEVWHADW